MAVLPIRIYPDPVLRVDCAPVDRFDEELVTLVRDMIETMHHAPGVGLAAPQIGVERRIAVIDTSVGKERSALHVLVNPQIVESTGSESDFEGCLSIPDLSEKVERPTSIRLRASDLTGQSFELVAEDFTARAICHEIDHLDGVLFVDRLRGLRRERARRHLRKMIRTLEEAEQVR